MVLANRLTKIGNKLSNSASVGLFSFGIVRSLTFLAHFSLGYVEFDQTQLLEYTYPLRVDPVIKATTTFRLTASAVITVWA